MNLVETKVFQVFFEQRIYADGKDLSRIWHYFIADNVETAVSMAVALAARNLGGAPILSVEMLGQHRSSNNYASCWIERTDE